MRQTGGSALGTISTKSNSESSESCWASVFETTPTCSPSAFINLTSGDVIFSLRRVFFSKLINQSSKLIRPRQSISSFKRLVKLSSVIEPKSSPPRVRTVTVFSSCSRAPKIT